MSIFRSLFGKKKIAAHNPIRETLFGDMPIEQWPRPNAEIELFPWITFASAREHLASGRREAAFDCWRQIIEHRGLEPRQYLQAWHFLRQHGEAPPPDVAKQVLGIVVEVAMPEGLDLLAAYPNHSARYYNFSGAGVVWEHPDSSLDPAIDQLLEASRQVVAQLGPWKEARPAPPPRDHARLSFLTPSGLHFGQGPMDVLARDPLGAQVLQLASELMRALIAKTNAA
jgi:hypothetical protein